VRHLSIDHIIHAKRDLNAWATDPSAQTVFSGFNETVYHTPTDLDDLMALAASKDPRFKTERKTTKDIPPALPAISTISFPLFTADDVGTNPSSAFGLLLGFGRDIISCQPQKIDMCWAVSTKQLRQLSAKRKLTTDATMCLPAMNPHADKAQMINLIDPEALSANNLAVLTEAIKQFRCKKSGQTPSTMKLQFAVDLLIPWLDDRIAALYREHLFMTNDADNHQTTSKLWPLIAPAVIEGTFRLTMEWYYCVL
jgi:hypothetical protein